MTEVNHKETVDARLRRLAAATADITPPPGLAERLAERYRAGRPSVRGIAAIVLPFYRPALLAASLAAAASIALAVQVGFASDEAVAQAEDGGLWDL